MEQSVGRRAVSLVSKGLFDAVLKPAGFKRAGANAYRINGDLIHELSVKSDRWGTASESSFGIVIGVSDPLVMSILWPDVARKPGTINFPILLTLNDLTPDHSGVSWQVTQQTDTTEIVGQVNTLVSQYAMPFFDRLDGRQAVLDEMMHPSRPYQSKSLVIAILQAGLGMSAQANASLAKARAECRVAAYFETIDLVERRLRTRYGL